jgi:hypothetical protein
MVLIGIGHQASGSSVRKYNKRSSASEITVRSQCTIPISPMPNARCLMPFKSEEVTHKLHASSQGLIPKSQGLNNELCSHCFTYFPINKRVVYVPAGKAVRGFGIEQFVVDVFRNIKEFIDTAVCKRYLKGLEFIVIIANS